MHDASKGIGAAVKEKDNPFFKSKYADLGSVIKTFKEPMLDAGLTYVQLPINKADRVGVVTRLMHTSGQWIEESFTIPLTKQDPQAVGSALTYCRRYALSALFGIPTADSDAEAAMYRDGPLFTSHQKARFDELLKTKNAMGYAAFSQEVGEDVMQALSDTFPSAEKAKDGELAKSAGKKLCKELSAGGWDQLRNYATQIQELIAKKDPMVLELTGELLPVERRLVAGLLTDIEVAHLKKLKELAA